MFYALLIAACVVGLLLRTVADDRAQRDLAKEANDKMRKSYLEHGLDVP